MHTCIDTDIEKPIQACIHTYAYVYREARWVRGVGGVDGVRGVGGVGGSVYIYAYPMNYDHVGSSSCLHTLR